MHTRHYVWCRTLLGIKEPPPDVEALEGIDTDTADHKRSDRCPVCKEGHMHVIEELMAAGR